MPRLLLVFLAAGALGAVALAPRPAVSSEPADPSGAPNYDEIAYGVCVHCHGAHGEGRPELDAPRIGDLGADYLRSTMLAYRDGSRGVNPEAPGAMAMVALLKGAADDAAVERLAAFVAKLDPEHRDAGPATPAGAPLYAACSGCHGGKAEGNAGVGAPPLQFQEPAYLGRQIANFRDGHRSDAAASLHSGLVGRWSDEQVQAVSGHIASLRPARPALENYEVTLSEAEGLAAFNDIYATAVSPRCRNCHPAGDQPLHTDQSIPHGFGVTRFSPQVGVHCSTCHAALPANDGLAPQPPADPIWSLAPKAMVFEGVTPAQLCKQLKDPAINGGRGHVGTTKHVATDHLLITSWHSGRTPPPLSHEELVQRFETWGRAGGPCPE